MLDGIDIKLIAKDDLRRSMAMVLQDTHLFAGTILDNIRYGRLNASDEEVIEAAKLANADSFIRRLPEGYHTRISSDGASLPVVSGSCFPLREQPLQIRRCSFLMKPHRASIPERKNRLKKA